jgi:hypothetical protein
MFGFLMNDVYYYLGKYRVRVVTQSIGYWIVEALEEFEDDVDGEKVKVAVGERRIVPIDTIHERKYLAPPVKEHAYELQMEKKLKQLIDKQEKAQNSEE